MQFFYAVFLIPVFLVYGLGGDHGGVVTEARKIMWDLFYLGVWGGFFALSWWLVQFCDRLDRSGR